MILYFLPENALDDGPKKTWEGLKYAKITKTILKNISETFVELEVYNYEKVDYIQTARLESFDWLNLSRSNRSLSDDTLDI